MLTGHGGNIDAFIKKNRLDIDAAGVIDLSVNTNPFKYPGGLIEHLKNRMGCIDEYPDVDASALRASFAACHGLEPENIIVGNGTTEILYMIPRAFDAKEAVCAAPAYSDYADAVEMAGGAMRRFTLAPERDFELTAEAVRRAAAAAGAVFICHPNNPNGRLAPVDDVKSVIQDHPGALFVIDEAYLPLCSGPDAVSFVQSPMPPNLVVLRSMTKAFSIPGLRLGYAAGAPGTIRKLYHQKEPWTVNAMAQSAGLYLCGHFGWLEETAEKIAGLRESFTCRIAGIGGIKSFHSDANFLLLKTLRPEATAHDIRLELLRRGYFIRDCSNYPGLDESFFRVSVADAETMAGLATELEALSAG